MKKFRLERDSTPWPLRYRGTERSNQLSYDRQLGVSHLRIRVRLTCSNYDMIFDEVPYYGKLTLHEIRVNLSRVNFSER